MNHVAANHRAYVICGALAAAALLFLALLYGVENSRQNEVFPYRPFCDYRSFMLPCMTSERPYHPNGAERRDACYPAVVYAVVSRLSTNKGETWKPIKREWLYFSSIVLLELVGLAFLLVTTPDGLRLPVAASLICSPALLSSVLRGNPSGWAFALVCIFLFGYKKNAAPWRYAAAAALGGAVAIKLTPVLFGLLYLCGRADKPRLWPWKDILTAASVALLLTFVPFIFYGGPETVSTWLENAFANSRFYSVYEPIWGFTALLNALDPTGDVPRLTACAVILTKIAMLTAAAAALFARTRYLQLMLVGIAMTFAVHHDYGAAYLLPAFVAWLSDGYPEGYAESRIANVIEGIAWFMILTPLQIPCAGEGTMNFVLQGEALLLLAASTATRYIRGERRERRPETSTRQRAQALSQEALGGALSRHS